MGRPTKFGNPYRCTQYRDKAATVELYRYMLHQEGCEDLVAAIKDELRGKDLACWCKPGQPCHADVLLEIANA